MESQQAKSGQQEAKEQNQSQGQEKEQPSTTEKLGLPEWITLPVGLAIVLTVVGLLTYLHFTGPQGPPLIEINPHLSQVSEHQAGFYLPISITNTGGEVAEDVLVKITVAPREGNVETITYQVRFLAADETHQAVLVFNSNPAEAEILTQVSFHKP